MLFIHPQGAFNLFGKPLEKLWKNFKTLEKGLGKIWKRFGS